MNFRVVMRKSRELSFTMQYARKTEREAFIETTPESCVRLAPVNGWEAAAAEELERGAVSGDDRIGANSGFEPAKSAAFEQERQGRFDGVRPLQPVRTASAYRLLRD